MNIFSEKEKDCFLEKAVAAKRNPDEERDSSRPDAYITNDGKECAIAETLEFDGLIGVERIPDDYYYCTATDAGMSFYDRGGYAELLKSTRREEKKKARIEFWQKVAINAISAIVGFALGWLGRQYFG